MNSWRHRFAGFSRGIAHAVLQAGLLCGLGLAGQAAHAEDDPPGRVGRLAEMKGQVWLLEAGQGEWQTAERNRPVTTADRLATDADSRAELQIGSTIVRIDQGSDLEVTRLDDERVELMLHSGAAALRVREAEVAREVMLMTPEGRFQPRTAGLYRIDRSERGSVATATQGELDFESSDAQLALRPGQRAELWFDPSDNRTHYNWAGMPNDEFENWVRQEDARDQRYASQRPISPEMTGADDLDGNGQWDTHPEYGSVWTPTTVAVGWAPYRYGRWAWVRPWGWTWVDDAPWGFAPFHYGRWVHWRSRWFWAPGTYVRRPIYAPAMVAWVGGSHLSVGISIGRPVGWVPLAPREVYRPMYKVSPVYIKQVNVTHVHIHDHHRHDRRPNQPVSYRNSSVAGGVTVVSSDVLTRRQPISKAQRAPDTSVMAAMRSRRAEVGVEPPKPDNASLAPRSVRRPDAAVAPPPRSVAQAAERTGRIPRAAQDRGGLPPNGGARGEPRAVRSPSGNGPREPQAGAREPGRPDQVREPGQADRVRERAERPAVPRPPITQRNETRDGVAPAPQPRQRDNPRRELLQPAPGAEPAHETREPRERREPREPQARPFAPQPQAEPRDDRPQRQMERPERAERQQRSAEQRPERQEAAAERPERQARVERQERPDRQEQRAERQQQREQREERQERQREPGQKRERERDRQPG